MSMRGMEVDGRGWICEPGSPVMQGLVFVQRQWEAMGGFREEN